MRLRLLGVSRAVARGTEHVAASLLLAVVMVNLAQVVFRYVLNAPLGWTEEAMRYGIVWLTFLGAGTALLRGEHMAVDLVNEYGGRRLRRIAAALALLATGALAVLLVWKGIPFMLRGLGQASPSARIPMALPYAAIVCGGALLLVQAAALVFTPPPGRPEEGPAA